MERSLCAGRVQQWTLHTADLSAYAGKTVMITFVAQTDGNPAGGNYFINDVFFSGE
jgi:hypothetical protein